MLKEKTVCFSLTISRAAVSSGRALLFWGWKKDKNIHGCRSLWWRHLLSSRQLVRRTGERGAHYRVWTHTMPPRNCSLNQALTKFHFLNFYPIPFNRSLNKPSWSQQLIKSFVSSKPPWTNYFSKVHKVENIYDRHMAFGETFQTQTITYDITIDNGLYCKQLNG